MAEIILNHVSFSYEDRGESFEALRDIDLTIKDGEFICVVGPSGCGKTTLLRLLAGLARPTEGEILIGGEPVDGPSREASIVFQDYALFPWMTARKNVQFGIAQTHPGMLKDEVRQRTEAILEKVDMLASADKHPYQMSGGMRQRVAIARALALDREILLLDEPFGALDARIRGELQNLLEELWAGARESGDRRKTVVFVTHDIPEAVRLSDRILFMMPGHIAEEIEVPVARPRRDPDDKAVFEMKKIRRSLTEKMIISASARGRGCACGGPA